MKFFSPKTDLCIVWWEFGMIKSFDSQIKTNAPIPTRPDSL